jgi:hypothetical protein
MCKRIALSLLVFCLLTVSCKKIGEIAFNLDYQTSFQIPSSIGVNVPVTIPTPDVATNSSQEFRTQGIDPSKIREVRLSEIKLTVISPSGKTFSFLKSVHLYMVTPSLPEIEIAYLDNVPVNAASISLISANADLAEYVKGDSFKLRSRVVTRETVFQDVTIQVDMRIAGKASVL